ncbi:hypothetical protein WKR88_27725 [Trinickia caryophylli]|nr:hypothetical protein [Trinickia caryophylli]WQE11195.1 hypothetical protein U0034_15730 [Trinickia caryophylli]
MKAWIAALTVVWALGACAQSGASGSSQGGSITMYGTIDTGVTIRK